MLAKYFFKWLVFISFKGWKEKCSLLILTKKKKRKSVVFINIEWNLCAFYWLNTAFKIYFLSYRQFFFFELLCYIGTNLWPLIMTIFHTNNQNIEQMTIFHTNNQNINNYFLKYTLNYSGDLYSKKNCKK
jgi:fatty acid desaturase